MPIQDAKNEQQKKKKNQKRHPIALEEEKELEVNDACPKDQMSHAQQRKVLEAEGNGLRTPNFNLKESNRVAARGVDLKQDSMQDREKEERPADV